MGAPPVRGVDLAFWDLGCGGVESRVCVRMGRGGTGIGGTLERAGDQLILDCRDLILQIR